MKNKKGFTLIELIVVIAILGILALFLVPSFMGYARDAKAQVMKANVKTGQDAYMYAWTKYEDTKKETDQKKLIEQEVCGNLESAECYFIIDGSFPSMKDYPRYVFLIGSTLDLDQSYITYYLDKNNFCSYSYGSSKHGIKDRWLCTVNGESMEPEEVK